MARYNEVLTAYERYQLGKKYRMSDILRGQFFSDNPYWREYKGRGVVRHSTLDNGVEYVNCYNFEKYNSLFTTRIYCNLISIDDIPAGLMVETVESGHNINVFLPCHDYEDCNINRICVRINQGMENKYSMRHPMEENEQRAWNKENSDILFQKHLEFDSDFITQLWQKLNVPMTKEQMDMYRDTIDSNWDKYTQVQKDKIAKEIIFYILPQITSNIHMEEMTVVEGFCKFIAEKYDIGITAEVDSRKRLSLLKEHFLINTIEKAKEYYIANECSVERYKDFCLKVDYDEIMDSFEQWDISRYKEAWTKEALERCFDVQDIFKDWNVERILRLIETTKSDVSVFHKLKDYIQKHIDDIYVRDVLISHVQDLMDNNNLTQESLAVLQECCDKLQGFDARELTMCEEEFLRKVRNGTSIHEPKFYFISSKEKVIIIQGSTRLRPIRHPEDPRFEWSPKEENPREYTLWSTDGFIGKMEVAEHCIIWNMIGDNKLQMVQFFTNFVRNLEIIPPEREIRYATHIEAEYWHEEAIKSCVGNGHFFEIHSKWWIATNSDLIPYMMYGIINEIKENTDFENPGWRHRLMAVCLVFYVLPNIQKNPNICTDEQLQIIGKFLQKVTNSLFQIHITSGFETPETMIAIYRDYYLVNTKEKAKTMYTLGFRQDNDNFRAQPFIYEEILKSFKEFDISHYEHEWAQEIFDYEIKEIRQYNRISKTLLDLMEDKVNTVENIQLVLNEYNRCTNKEYIMYRLENMLSNVNNKEIYYLLKNFISSLQ